MSHLLARFDARCNLQKACGLSPTTIRYRVRYARDLLWCFRIREARDLRCWSAHQINNYVSRLGSRCRPSSGQVLACSIRSFLKFLALRGFLDRDLAVAVPSFAQWRLGSLPRTVDGDHLQRLVDASDPTTPVGMRDRAVLVLPPAPSGRPPLSALPCASSSPAEQPATAMQ